MSLERLDGATGGFRCFYNGYEFGSTADTTAFEVKPVLDPAGRTVTHAVYSITVQEYIADATTTDALVLAAIQKLSRNAGRLIYEGRGFGDLRINIAAARDVKWGPITKAVACKAVGAGRAVLLTWSVEFAIPNCDDAVFLGVLYFNYSLGYDIDSHGYTTRRYSSELALAATKFAVGDRRIPDTADAHRERTVPALPVGFRRESQVFDLSLDKQTLKTQIVDTQLPHHIPPPGIVEVAFSQTFQSQKLGMWTVTFDATYDIDRVNGTAENAVLEFVGVMRRRVNNAENMRAGRGLGDPELVPGGDLDVIGGRRVRPEALVKLLPATASVSEPNIYGRQQARFSVTCIVSGGVGLSEILARGGLWTRLPEDANTSKNWDKWVASIPAAFGPRGSAVLSFRATEDKIIDLCGAVAVSPPGRQPTAEPRGGPGAIGGGLGGGLGALGGGLGRGAGGAIGGGAGGRLGKELAKAFPPPKADESWFVVQMFLTVRAATGRVIGSTLPTSPIPLDQSKSGSTWNATDALPNESTSSPFPPLRSQLSNTSSGGETFAQQRTRPTLYLTLSGYALRAGYAVPLPELTQINGKTPLLVGEPVFTQGIVDQTLTVPIVRAEWSLTYALVDDGFSGAGVPVKAPLPVLPGPI